jgi:hypothetical protein|tara:strand:+ start:4026 stop:4385 length:360 start_codon:yes stop_codon:yes gene_type:complete
MNYISQSGADFLEMSNAKRLEDNKRKLESMIELREGTTKFAHTFDKEIQHLKSVISRAEAWIANNGEPPKRTYDIFKVIRCHGGEMNDEVRHFIDESQARAWGQCAEHCFMFKNNEIID